MDKYKRVETEKPSVPSVPNEVRVMTDGKMRNYIKYATTLLMVRSSSRATLQDGGFQSCVFLFPLPCLFAMP
jgi:hypothetical protein